MVRTNFHHRMAAEEVAFPRISNAIGVQFSLVQFISPKYHTYDCGLGNAVTQLQSYRFFH